MLASAELGNLEFLTHVVGGAQENYTVNDLSHAPILALSAAHGYAPLGSRGHDANVMGAEGFCRFRFLK